MCGLSKATKISQFSDVIPQKIVERLELIYEDVEDVDLFIAGISETPVKGKYISAFCSLTNRLTGKIFTEYMLMYERNLHRKKWNSILINDGENRVSY